MRGTEEGVRGSGLAGGVGDALISAAPRVMPGQDTRTHPLEQLSTPAESTKTFRSSCTCCLLEGGALVILSEGSSHYYDLY